MGPGIEAAEKANTDWKNLFPDWQKKNSGYHSENVIKS